MRIQGRKDARTHDRRFADEVLQMFVWTLEFCQHFERKFDFSGGIRFFDRIKHKPFQIFAEKPVGLSYFQCTSDSKLIFGFRQMELGTICYTAYKLLQIIRGLNPHSSARPEGEFPQQLFARQDSSAKIDLNHH